MDFTDPQLLRDFRSRDDERMERLGSIQLRGKAQPTGVFSDSNGGNDSTTANPTRLQYAPLQQLATDLATDNVAELDYAGPVPRQAHGTQRWLQGTDGRSGKDSAGR
jgi:hypothetical protein